MKTKLFLSVITTLLGVNAMADFNLSTNQKSIVCYGADNQSLNLNAKRTRIKYSVEGESSGSKKIIEVKTDNKTFISYSTSELTLTLSNDGDMFHYNGDELAQEVKCK